MITLPNLVERPEQPYVAIRQKVTMPFTPVIDQVMPEVAGWLQGRGVQRLGPAIFRYNLIDMPRLEVEMGFAPAQAIEGDERVLSKSLPAGLCDAHTSRPLRKTDGSSCGAHWLGQADGHHLGF